MSKGNLLTLLEKEFHQLCRNFTYITVAIVLITAVIFWWNGVEVKGNAAILIGVMFMVLAVFTLNIPYFTYRFMLSKYKDDSDKHAALGPSWREFRDGAMKRK